MSRNFVLSFTHQTITINDTEAVSDYATNGFIFRKLELSLWEIDTVTRVQILD